MRSQSLRVALLGAVCFETDAFLAAHKNAFGIQSRSAHKHHRQELRASADLSGEWAGWQCKFSGTNGERQPIPEDYLPESMREWEVPIWGFEVLTSEKMDGTSLYRKRAQVYPETGCALDDLALERSTTTIQLNDAGNRFEPYSDGYVLLTAADDELQPIEVAITRGQSDRRVRVALTLNTDARKPVRPITVTKERKYSSFDDGNMYHDGLDNSTLMDTIGARCFAEYELAAESASQAKGLVKSMPLWGGVTINIGAEGYEFGSNGLPVAVKGSDQWLLQVQVQDAAGISTSNVLFEGSKLVSVQHQAEACSEKVMEPV